MPAQGQASGAAAATLSGITTAATQKKTDRKKSKENGKAEDAYLTGARLLERHDLSGAERAFARSAELAPDNSVYAMALASVREGHVTELVQSAGRARLLGKDAEAETLLAQARAIDPDNSLVLQHPPPGTVSPSDRLHAGPNSGLNSWIVDGPRLAGPIELKATPGVKSFHVHATIAEVAREVAIAYGLKPSIDTSVASKAIKFDLEDVTYAQAMHVLSEMGQVFAVPLAEQSVLIAKDDRENRLRFEHLIQETIYAAGLTNEQIGELSNMIKGVFEVRQISVENSFGSLVVRAPEETLRVLNLTLAGLLDGGSQVMFDLKLYSVATTRTTNVGATLPSQGGAYSVASEANNIVQQNQTVVNQAIAQGLIPAGASNLEIAIALIESGLVSSSLLSSTFLKVGGGLSTIGVYSSVSSTLNFGLNASDTRALDEIQLRVGDRQSATFRAGSKYPITQSTYASTIPASTTAALAGQSLNGVPLSSLLAQATTQTVPQVQYEDLGVTLKVTPTVQKSGMISVHLDLKIESLAGGTIDNIPILDNDQLTSDVTVPDGGTAFLVSNMTKNQSAAVTGIPGLSELPGFQSAPEQERTTAVSQLLMVLTPRLVRLRPGIGAGPAIPFAVPANAAD